MQEGDNNTKFFHAQASQRKKANTIMGLRHSDGSWKTELSDIEQLTSDYFSQLFASSNLAQVDEVVRCVDKVVTPQMNEDLIRPYSKDEVRAALFQMHPSKAPEPDGMSPLFFQKYWSIVGEDVCAAVLDCLHSSRMLKAINFTHIALIPKVKNLDNLSQYRPINLCNVLYRIVAKVIYNRLKKVMPFIIFDSQGSFVPGRLITDNILVAYELLHTMKQKRKGGKKHVAIKLDMSKAYDQVEWNYLKAVMLKLGFHSKLIDLIMECVSTVSYSILIGEEPVGRVVPGRGLRQGDPLSPYLFLLCAEGLSSLLRKAKAENLISGMAVSRHGPIVSHLFFADDSLLFYKASVEACEFLKEVLNVYGRASGQRLNEEKTGLFFSNNTNEMTRSSIQRVFGAPRNSNIGKYLELPSLVGRDKRKVFEDIKTRVWQKLQGWKSKLVSQAGREILIKVVVQAIPSYAMSVFRLPFGLCDELERMVQSFWWGQKNQERKMHWMKWSKMCKSKWYGGMGFRDTRLFNQALLACQC